jgi:hypothetical protein
MQIFEFRDEVVGDYREYIESFISIAYPRIRQAVDQALQIGFDRQAEIFPAPLRCSKLRVRNFPFLEVFRSGALF